MDLLTPKLGLFFWALVIFLILVFILKKFAWKPIMDSIKQREEDIQSSIDEAKKAREEMANLKSENEALLAEARAERDAMLKEARSMADQLVSESREKAVEESKKVMEKAREEIRAEKMQALTDVKNQVAVLSIEIAEKILRQELSNPKAQSEVVEKLVSDLNLN
ncbi:MAG: F0F1 ATP synthase subunit B [Bacteroidota bacterium]